jgi:hypothetical protein
MKPENHPAWDRMMKRWRILTGEIERAIAREKEEEERSLALGGAS